MRPLPQGGEGWKWLPLWTPLLGKTLARCFHSLVATGAHGSLCSRYNRLPQMGRPKPEVTSGRAGTGPGSTQAQASSGPSGASVTWRSPHPSLYRA